MSAATAASTPADGPRAAATQLGLVPLQHGLCHVVAQVVRLAAELLPQTAAAGCTLLAAGQITQALFTDPSLQAAYETSSRRGQGPVAEAAASAVPVASGDVAADWPDLATEQQVQRFRSAVVLPLTESDLAKPGDDVVAVLSLHARATAAYDVEVVAAVRPFAAQAAVTVANARLFDATTALTQQLQEALASRGVIEQAKGALMARRRVSADAAFELLRRSSQRRNIKLREVAQEVVDSLLPPT